MTDTHRPAEAAHRATIMLVDDEPLTLELIESFLEGEGYRRVVKTADAREALPLLTEHQPDVLLLDLVMPHVSGLEILEALRAEPALAQMPVIVLTSSTDAQTKLRALELGASDFLNKPVDPDELVLRLRNSLAAKAHHDRLQADLEQKVEERTAELNVMRLEAERASEAKSFFLANMSHEIRTPMTAICGYSDLLMEDERIQDDQRESLGIIKRNGDHLLAIINGILDLSKIEAGHVQVERAPLNLVELVVEVVHAMRVRADERGIELGIEFASPMPASILSDAVRIRQAVVNLVGNAIKFTEQGSVKIRLHYDHEPSLARIDVIDTGIGVAPERIPSMFLEFEQADASTSRTFGGSGLGLAITRRLAQMLEGDCSMQSELGVGSTLSLTFKAPVVDQAEIRSVPESFERAREENPVLVPEPRIRARILLAEDGEDNQRLIARILTNAGAEVEVAENGRVAIDALRTGAGFDLVLMDMAMPEIDGYTATRTLRGMGFELPIVALTAHALEGEREKCLAAGCDAYATKPIDRRLLLGIVRGLLEKRGTPQPPPPDGVEPITLTRVAPPRPPRTERPGWTGEATSASDSHKNATIMMVDDEPTTLDIIEMFLQGEGYSNFVRTSHSTRALALLAKHRPDILLLDLLMPDMDGLEVLAAMREDDALRHTPVLILTSSSDAELKLKALELGANDFLSKPVDSSELALRLRNTLAAKAHQDRLAYYDGLTGLPNRRLFLDRLDRAVSSTGHESGQCTVLHINLNRFKQINDTLGPGAGDALLTAVADRMQNSVRDPLARTGGDEFSLLLPRTGSVEAATRVSQRMIASLAEPFTIDGQDVFVSCSIGIAVFPDDGGDIETLLRNAHVAASHARLQEDSPYQFYRESLNAESMERLSLETSLRSALRNSEMFLHYQPKVDLVSRRIVGAEALMRWQHPRLGLLLPSQFIGIAEETGLIESLGQWALHEACRQSKAWLARGHRPMRVAVNVSSRQFRAGNLVETIRAALEQSGLDGEYLSIELTESQIMADLERTSSTLRELKQMGVRISVDDFGTGYSSLTRLKRLPLDELKIDRSFIASVPGDAADAAIVSAIIGLAHSLGLQVVAEGVETREQLEFLSARGCDIYQGFLFCEPTRPADWTALFERDQSES